ncbi:hypothetical protein [Desulfonatronum sp. SC1]|uniref:hypothetical protein n=1 Tax=Desulfonatronum sp. SC1 TaxID=2109626 RepID=UPI0011B23461|nr:hypothetical protein [Desulfonatronum sp. SC1]
MNNLCTLTVLLAGLFLSASSFAHHPVPHDRQTPGKSFGLNADRDDLLQFASGGHVIGFGKDSVYVAGLDRVLRVEFAGGRPVQPVAEDGGLSADGISSLGTVTYSGVWGGVILVKISLLVIAIRGDIHVRRLFSKNIAMHDFSNLFLTRCMVEIKRGVQR